MLFQLPPVDFMWDYIEAAAAVFNWGILNGDGSISGTANNYDFVNRFVKL